MALQIVLFILAILYLFIWKGKSVSICHVFKSLVLDVVPGQFFLTPKYTSEGNLHNTLAETPLIHLQCALWGISTLAD